MKRKIQEVQEYFKNKILTGNFTVLSVKEYALEIKIDGEYLFTIWVGNEETCQQHDVDYYTNFISIPKFSAKEIAKCWEIFEPLVKEARAEQLRLEKLDKLGQYNRLKRELKSEGIIS